MWKILVHIGMFVIALDSIATIATGGGDPGEWFLLIGAIAIETADIVMAIKNK